MSGDWAIRAGAASLAAAALAGWATVRAGAPPPRRVPRLVFSATRADLGAVRVGEHAEARFSFRNGGAGPLHIMDVEGGCGCVSADYPRTVAAGASGEVRVRFEPKLTWQGLMRKEIRVRSNDALAAEQRVLIQADVVPFFTVEPSGGLSIRYRPGEIYRREVRLFPRAGSSLTFSDPRTDSPWVRARLAPPLPSDPQRVYRLMLEIGPCPGPGDLRTAVRLTTSERRIRETRLGIRLFAASGPVVSPPSVFLPFVRPDAGGTDLATVQVYSRAPPFRVLGAETGDPNLAAATSELRPGYYQVTLRYLGGWKPGPVSSTIRVRTDDRANPVLRVPLNTVVP